MERMANEGDDAINFLRARIKPVGVEPAPKSESIEALARQLSDTDRDLVRSASSRLRRLGTAAHPALRKLLETRMPPATRDRLELLLSAKAPAPSKDQVRVCRAVHVAERVGTPSARKLLQSLTAEEPHDEIAKHAAAASNRLDLRTKKENLFQDVD